MCSDRCLTLMENKFKTIDNIFCPKKLNVADRDRSTSSSMETSKCQGQLNETGIRKKKVLLPFFTQLLPTHEICWAETHTYTHIYTHSLFLYLYLSSPHKHIQTHSNHTVNVCV